MITNRRKKVALIGSKTLFEMIARGCFDNYEIVGDFITLNSVSQCMEDTFGIGGMDIVQSKNIMIYLRTIKPDYLMVNLEFAIPRMYRRECESIKGYKVDKPIQFGHQIEVNSYEKKLVLDMIQAFAKQLKQIFPSNRIILMSCIMPGYFLSANNLLDNFASVEYNTFYKTVESLFVDITNCKVWDFPSKKCPLQKIPNQRLDDFLFFDGFYSEAKTRVDMLFNDNIEGANTPSLKFYIEIFRRIKQDIFNRKALKALIASENNAVLNLLLNTSINFVEKHFEIFSEYYNNNLSITEMLRKSTELQDNEILQFLKCYNVILRHEYFSLDVDYSLMFKYNFQMLSSVVRDVQKYCEKSQIYVTVTPNNLFYYFSYMKLHYQLNHEYSNKSATSLLQQLVLTSNKQDINVAPIKVDVWGACISRFIFYEDDRNFKVNQYLLHVDPIAVMSDIQLNVVEPENMTWQQSMVFKQIRGIDSFIESYDKNATWLITDCYFMTAPNHFKTPMGYIQSPDTDYALYDLHLPQEKTAYLQEPFENLIPYLNRYIEFLSERYGSRIILVRHYYQKYYIDALGKIQDFSYKNSAWGVDEQNLDFYNKLNELCKKTEEYIINRLGCYVIDIAKYFLPDERSMLNLHHFHLERTFFVEAAKIIKIIIQNEPVVRIYNDYSPEEKINRYIGLAAKNEKHPCVKELFKGHWLDKYLHRIPLELIIAFKNDFIDLYKKPYDSLLHYLNTFPVCDKKFIDILNQYSKE